jgi:putative ABC transport system permease protein
VIVGLSGLMAVVLAGLNERRRELAILRSVGAKPRDVFMLLSFEGLFITLLGVITGVLLLTILTTVLAPIAQSRYGIAIQVSGLSSTECYLLSAVMLVGLLASLVPGYRAYQLSLLDGLTPRI